MGLGAQDADVNECSEDSGELLDTHELGGLVDTPDMQANGDDADEGQPADEAAVQGSADTTGGGDARRWC